MMGLDRLRKSLLSTRPQIALRDPESSECLVRLTRDQWSVGQSVLLVEVDYLWQIMSVDINSCFYDLSEVVGPAEATEYIVDQLQEEEQWEIRHPTFGGLTIRVVERGDFIVLIGGIEVAYGYVYPIKEHKEFIYRQLFDFNPRTGSLLTNAIGEYLDAKLAPPTRHFTIDKPTVTQADLALVLNGGIKASSQSAKDYRALAGLTIEQLNNCHIIVISLPREARLLPRHWLRDILLETVIDCTPEQHENKFVFVGFEKHQRILLDVLQDLFKEEEDRCKKKSLSKKTLN